MQLVEETRTDIEELYLERIAAFNNALNEKLSHRTKEFEFEKRQNEIIRKEKNFLEDENRGLRKQLAYSYLRNSELKIKNHNLTKNNLLENQ